MFQLEFKKDFVLVKPVAERPFCKPRDHCRQHRSDRATATVEARRSASSAGLAALASRVRKRSIAATGRKPSPPALLPPRRD